MKKIIAFFLLGTCFFYTAYAGELIVIKSKNKTSTDISLEFVMEKTRWDGEDINVWGTVKNTGTKTYKMVRVMFTARDKNGRFIGRNDRFTDPKTIGPGQVGYIVNKHIECDRRRPKILEFKVSEYR
ncbi:MAG: hypothetical protein ACI86H_002916 [bacterium]|jgi:hypothetical protein